MYDKKTREVPLFWDGEQGKGSFIIFGIGGQGKGSSIIYGHGGTR